MTEVTDKLVRDALQLEPAERAAIIEELLSSLDRPDPAIDGKWAKEAEDRLARYRAGEIEAVAAKDVFAELGRN